MAKKKEIDRFLDGDAPTKTLSLDRAKTKKGNQTAPNYTEDDIIQCISIYDLSHNYAEVSRRTGIDRKLVTEWVKNRDTKLQKLENLDERVEVFKKNSIISIESLLDKALKRVEEALPQASAAQAATVYGILFDKHAILVGDAAAGKQTNNIYIGNMPIEDQQALMQRALARSKSTIIETTGTEDIEAESENTPEESTNP